MGLTWCYTTEAVRQSMRNTLILNQSNLFHHVGFLVVGEEISVFSVFSVWF